MKPFIFPLESLRVLRKQRERAAQQRYARSLANCRKAELQMQTATAEWEASLVELKREMGAGISAGQFANLRNGCLVLEIRWRERQAALLEARRVAALIFQEMAAATREREGLDQFHNRARREHELQFRRAEQKIFDEMATQNAGSDRMWQFTTHAIPDPQ
jgi:flagellar export protein FliJ